MLGKSLTFLIAFTLPGAALQASFFRFFHTHDAHVLFQRPFSEHRRTTWLLVLFAASLRLRLTHERTDIVRWSAMHLIAPAIQYC
jgi:hypothetical protein